MVDPFEIFRKRVRQALESRGWTDQLLAAKAGIQAPNLSKYLTGKKNPSVPVALKIAAKLELSLSDLFEEAKSEAGPPVDVDPRLVAIGRAAVILATMNEAELGSLLRVGLAPYERRAFPVEQGVGRKSK